MKDIMIISRYNGTTVNNNTSRFNNKSRHNNNISRSKRGGLLFSQRERRELRDLLWREW